MAFSVGFIFSGERDSGSVITSTSLGTASAHAPVKEQTYQLNFSLRPKIYQKLKLTTGCCPAE